MLRRSARCVTSKPRHPGEHDFGTIELEGERFFFKIDYYDRDVRMHSPDPANPDVTTRIMTVMLSSEY